jgi:hypothetical protein
VVPTHPTFGACFDRWVKEPYLLYTRNSFLDSIASAGLALFISCRA